MANQLEMAKVQSVLTLYERDCTALPCPRQRRDTGQGRHARRARCRLCPGLRANAACAWRPAGARTPTARRRPAARAPGAGGSASGTRPGWDGVFVLAACHSGETYSPALSAASISSHLTARSPVSSISRCLPSPRLMLATSPVLVPNTAARVERTFSTVGSVPGDLAAGSRRSCGEAISPTTWPSPRHRARRTARPSRAWPRPGGDEAGRPGART